MSYLNIITAVVAGASIISALIPKDTHHKALKTIKNIADILAVNVGHASN